MFKRPTSLVSDEFALARGARAAEAPRKQAPGPVDDALPPHITLTRGRAFHVYAREGAILHVRRGNVQLTPAPRWIAATMWASPLHMPTGEAYVVETTGWLLIASDEGAEVACHDVEAEEATPWLMKLRRSLFLPLKR
jgi:hypothetical protein